ncbi:conserved protein of unknown function [Tenacibaculum sp. 190130A14a]|uniref:Por secretion system C-terminal sorting domain-containing protein n=1 Tax=Tenacibaculum polynesiense TaxID=3137857 RepID=A0ABM9PA27_9FLAO
MNKKLLPFFGLLMIAGVGLILKDSFKKESEVEKLRKQHAEFLQNHPYQKIAELPKKQRKAMGLPPNAYFEQKSLSEIDPSTGQTHREKIYDLQEKLNKRRAGLKAPGEADNAWVERGPDNVGGRTRALIFDPNDATNETVFAGGVSGGLWKNTNISNSNSKWERVGIPENLAVSSIAVDPNNSQIFYVGTGETFVNGEINGDGLWKSTDGGTTWNRIIGREIGSPVIKYNVQLTVNSPASVANDYIAILSKAFGSAITTPITSDIVLAEDDNGDASVSSTDANDACDNITNAAALNGKIAIVRRGACNFSLKALKVQQAGAKAIIIVNNQDTAPFNMAAGTDGPSVTIPSIMVGKNDGESLITALGSGAVNVTLTGGDYDAVNGFATVEGIHHINDIVVRNNGGTSEVFIAVGDVFYRYGATNLGGDTIGIYKSTDGENFTKLDVRTATGNSYHPVRIKIAADNSIYVSTKRSSAFRDGQGAILKSTDGTNFDLVYTVADANRTEIVVSPTNANTVYVLAEGTSAAAPVKMLKTTDNFATVTDLALPNDADNGIPANDFTRGQAWYDLLLAIDPNNENVLYAGGIDLFKSTDGGTSWTQISKWSNNNNLAALGVPIVHADQHGMAFASSSRMLFGTDGGVYFSNNGGTTIGARNKNYNTLQFYTLGVAPTTAFGGNEFFIAGAQDNGTQLVENATAGINSSERAAGGDGAASFFDQDGTDRYFITNYVYNNSINLYNYATSQWTTINSENASRGDFINQEDLDSQLNILYSNYTEGDSDFVIRRYSNILGSSGAVVKDELRNDLMNVEPSLIKVSPHTTTSTTLFVGLRNGKVLKVEKANEDTNTWTEITGSGFVGTVSDIEFGANENQIFVTFHNYGVTSVWYTSDGGTTWKSKEGDLPDIPVKTILQNPLNPKEVIIGTDLGVWQTDNFDADSPSWTQSYNGMSNVPVLDLDLRDDNVVFAATYGRGVFSGEFKIDPDGDIDGDGVLNGVDNCVSTANADQKDTDGNGVGDACQDTDGDGIMDDVDNCISTANPDQADADGNGVGDACQDSDGDGVMDNVDNCINKANPDQKDFNNDGVGDACQDSDGDGIMDDVDNCPGTANADQKDTDGNGVGDVCQDTDGDGVLDDTDNCPNNANADQADADGNGVGDACQDSDGDGIMDDVDNCINTANADQADGNNDGVGDVCDTSYEAQNNITASITSETCVDQNDGKITISVAQTFVNYTVTLNGAGKSETKNIIGTTSTTVFESLAPGSYEVCVSVDGRSYTQCFEFNIDEAAPVSLRVAKKQAAKEYTVEVNSGTAPYNVYLNGDLVGTFNSKTFNVQVEEKGVLEVKTAKACEGSFRMVIDGIFLKQNPISTKIEVLMPNNLNRDQVETMVYDLTGKVIFNQKVRVSGNTLTVPFENYNSGIYILKLGVENSEPIKILKR